MENFLKNLVRYSIIGIITVLLYFLFRSPGQDIDAEMKKKNDEAGSIGLLLGGTGAEEGSIGQSESLFESDFYKSGKIEYEESVATTEDGAVAENPVNPQTGQPYSDAVMNQFENLRKKFPGNDLIPKKMTDDDKIAKQEKDRQLAEASRAVYGKTATDEEIKMHFDNKLKQARDRKEIIDYLISSQGEDSEQMEKIKKVNSMIQKQYDDAAAEREKAYAEAGIALE